MRLSLLLPSKVFRETGNVRQEAFLFLLLTPRVTLSPLNFPGLDCFVKRGVPLKGPKVKKPLISNSTSQTLMYMSSTWASCENVDSGSVGCGGAQEPVFLTNLGEGLLFLVPGSGCEKQGLESKLQLID